MLTQANNGKQIKCIFIYLVYFDSNTREDYQDLRDNTETGGIGESSRDRRIDREQNIITKRIC